MPQQLSLSARPKSLDQLIGQDKMVNAIRGHIQSGRKPKAWLLTGSAGTGKTTTARILALSYQCQHQKKFGQPCKVCYANKASFEIHEINAAETRGINEIKEAFTGANYGLMGESSYRVYILDEAHQLTREAQDLALKYLEDSPRTTIFILCSTRSYKLVDTLRRRCTWYELKELGIDDITKLVERLLQFAKSDLPADRLTDALEQRKIISPGLIAQATEKYIAGCEPLEAVAVEGSVEIDTRQLNKAVTKGDWITAAKYLADAQKTDVQGIRRSLLAYLRIMLLESPEINERTEAVSKAIIILGGLENMESSVVSASMAAVLYQLTAIFSEYKR